MIRSPETICSLDDVAALEARIVASAELSLQRLTVLDATDPLKALARIRFEPVGSDPLSPERRLNFVEQINQTFTYLASLEAARWLLEEHPECAPLVLNLGTLAGSDIESKCGQFAAETFAATVPASNGKLTLDITKVRRRRAKHKFVFYLSPHVGTPRQCEDVVVRQLSHPALTESRDA
jgi:hypothetical protein